MSHHDGFPDEHVDQLLNSADPVDSASTAELLERSRTQWANLTEMRQRRRQVVVVAASGLAVAALLTVSMEWRREPQAVANQERQPAETTNLRASLDAHDQSSDSGVEVRQDSQRSQPLHSLPVGPHSSSIADGLPQAVAPESHGSPSGESQDVVWFNNLVGELGPIGSQPWQRAVHQLAGADARTQRMAIDLVPGMPDDNQQKRGIRLVAEAAGQERDRVLQHWCANEGLRRQVLQVAIAMSPSSKWDEWIEQARQPWERHAVCAALAADDRELAALALVELAVLPRWRSAVQSAAPNLSPSKLLQVVRQLNAVDPNLRIAATFILTTIPGPDIDRYLASLIVSGKYQRDAYVVLMARRTPAATEFLKQAETQSDLSAPLVSARLRFANVQPLLDRWISDSRGNIDEETDSRVHPQKPNRIA